LTKFLTGVSLIFGLISQESPENSEFFVSEDKKTVVKMAYIYSQEGRWDKAIAEYKKLIKLDPEDFNAQNMLGDVYVKKGEHQPAYDVYMVAADAYNRLGQTEKATVVYRKIAKLEAGQLNADSKKKQAVFQKQVDGESAMEANDLDKAVEAFKAVLQLDPERFEVYQRLGDLYIRKGQSDLAVKQYNEIAEIYFKNKLYKKAAPVYKKILELDPANVDAHAAMGEIHSRSGNESDAKKEYLLIAEAMLGKGDLETALSYSKKAVALKSIEAYYYLGQVYLLQQKYDDAKAEFEKLLKFKLNHVGALVSMGKIFEGKGQPDEALKHYQRALKVEKTNADALCAAAAIHESKGEKSQAAAYYREAATTYTALNNPAKAQDCAARSRALDPAAAPGEPAAAVEAVAQVEAPAPVNEPAPPPPHVLEAAPSPAVEPAAEPEPMMVAESPLLEPEAEAPSAQLDPSEELRTLINLADNYTAEENWGEAIELYERVLKIDSGHADAKEALAHAYAMLGKVARDSAPRPDESALRQKEEDDLARRMAEEAAAATARLEQLKRLAEDEQRKLEEMRKSQEAARLKLEEEERLKREAEETARLAQEAARHRLEEEDRRRMSEAEMRKNLEAEIRKQLEDEMRRKAEQEIRARLEAEMRQRMDEEKRKADEQGRKRAEDETRRRLEEESKKFEAEKADVRRKMEEEMRQAIAAQERAKSEREALEKMETLRKKEEQDSKLKLQQEVLARVQSDQKQRQGVLQRHIDDIRKKVEEANRSSQAPASSAPVPAPAAGAAGAGAAADDMDDFMTAAVADIYTKQGLINEAIRIYEKILLREPGNAEIRKKLDGLRPSTAPASPSAPAVPAAAAAPAAEPDAKKKSKVSYL
jgi:tetratricopeptide (TPR) repeat protein